jgi:hypothetical protein
MGFLLLWLRRRAERPNVVLVVVLLLPGYEFRMIALDMIGKVLVGGEVLSAERAGLEIHLRRVE